MIVSLRYLLMKNRFSLTSPMNPYPNEFKALILAMLKNQNPPQIFMVTCFFSFFFFFFFFKKQSS